MEEFDLNDAWKSGDKQAEEYYASIEPEVIEMARTRSKSILEELKRKVFWEWVAGVIAVGLLFFLYRDLPNYWVMVLFGALIMGLSSIPYYKMLKRIKETPTQNMIDCLGTYVEILDGFIKRLKFLMWVMIPIGFFAGLFASMEEGAKFDLDKIEWMKLLGLLGFTIVFFGILFWITFKWYLPKLYGKPRDEFQSMLDNLKK